MRANRGAIWQVLMLFTVVAIAAGITGCPPQQQPDDTLPPDMTPDGLQPQGEPIKIGAIFALTGPASSLGEPEGETARMLQDQINAEGGIDGRPIEILIRDTKGDETEGLAVTRELIDRENVVAIIGPSRSGTTLGIIETIQQAEIPLVACAAASKITDPVKEWVFVTPQNDADAVARIYGYLNAEGIDKIALMTSSDGYGIAGLEQLQVQAGQAGIEIVANEEFTDKDTDMTAQLTKIKGTDAGAVICWGIGPAPALIAKQMNQLGLTMPLIQSHGVANKRFIEAAGDQAEGVILPAGKLLVAEQLPDDDPQKELLVTYAQQFEERYGKEADTFGGHAWDAVMLVVNAIRENGAEPAQIREGLENTTDFVGIGGTFNFSAESHYGLSPEAFVMVRIENGDWTLIQ